jgi:RimJ/RimL family protein N-acetyltransferase
MTLDHDVNALPTANAKLVLEPMRTARLVLRAPEPRDVEAVAALANDIKVAQNTARIPHPYSVADAESWIASTNAVPGDESYLLTLHDDTVIGACGLHQVREDVPPEIGYWLGVSFWGFGYAREAVQAVITRAFDTLNYDLIVAGARISNPVSRRILESFGFQWTDVGLYRIRSLASSVPVDRFRLERDAWRAANANT